LVRSKRWIAAVCLGIGCFAAGLTGPLLGTCGPFTDVSDPSFCPFVLEIFTLGITTGTTATTYEPGGNVTRLQMAAFLSRGVDRILQRGSRRAMVKKFWSPTTSLAIGITTLADQPYALKSDGTDVWIAGNTGRVTRVHASDGRILQTWTGAVGPPGGILPAMGRVFIGGGNSGHLYQLDPRLPPGAVTTVASLASSPAALAFDGARVWSADLNGTVSIFTPGPTIPWTATTVTGFSEPLAILHDGSSIWITDAVAGTLLKLDSSGAVLQTVTVGDEPFLSVFDGTNIWVPNLDGQSVSVVRASSGAVLATLTGNGLSGPRDAAFDGQRVLVANNGGGVSVFVAASLAPVGSFPTPNIADAVCSDGINFWLALTSVSKLARF
jgi:outer membrane protein assembly factor BamB